MTENERKQTQTAIKRDKRVYETRVSSTVRDLVAEGLKVNKKALKRLAKH